MATIIKTSSAKTNAVEQKSGFSERDRPYRCTRISRNRYESANWSQKRNGNELRLGNRAG